jgi:hypothetical protein
VLLAARCARRVTTPAIRPAAVAVSGATEAVRTPTATETRRTTDQRIRVCPLDGAGNRVGGIVATAVMISEPRRLFLLRPDAKRPRRSREVVCVLKRNGYTTHHAWVIVLTGLTDRAIPASTGDGGGCSSGR